MGRHRIARINELNDRAQLVEDLGRMPDRAKEKDFRDLADLLRKTAKDMEDLIDAKLPGCICQRIDHDDYSYLIYATECRHHHQLHVLTEKVKADYARMEKTLKDEARMRLIATALTGAALLPDLLRKDGEVEYTQSSSLAAYAIEIADETIARLTESP